MKKHLISTTCRSFDKNDSSRVSLSGVFARVDIMNMYIKEKPFLTVFLCFNNFYILKQNVSFDIDLCPIKRQRVHMKRGFC